MSQQTITLHDKQFACYIKEKQIKEAIVRIAHSITKDYEHFTSPLVLVPVLNGAFVFAAELGKLIAMPMEFYFVRIASYQGLESGNFQINMEDLNNNIKGRNILVVEDILDTGKTIALFKKKLTAQNAASVKFACLFRKPGAVVHCSVADYVGIDIPNDFVVGYGMDYDGLGRNLNDLYKIV